MMTLADFYEALTGVVDNQPWREHAACKGLKPDLFLADRGESVKEAKAVCASCTVRRECLDYALTHCERWGVWGGTSERERKVLRRDVPRPLPIHGTVSRYSLGCHCDRCRAAYAGYRRERRVRGMVS